MGTIAIVVAGIVVIGIVGVVMVAAQRPKILRIERSMTTTASADHLYAIISDLHRWPEWSPWHKYDPNMTMSYTGGIGEVGATFAWEGNKQVGSGKNTILGVEPGKQIEFRLEMYSPFPATNRVYWRIDELNEMRRFTWAMECDHAKLMPRVMTLFMDMDKMVGGAFEEGLTSLKAIAERS